MGLVSKLILLSSSIFLIKNKSLTISATLRVLFLTTALNLSKKSMWTDALEGLIFYRKLRLVFNIFWGFF